MAIEDNAGIVGDRVWKIIERTVERLGIENQLSRDDLICNDEHVGPAYAVPTEEAIDAIRLLARTEGIFLDPIYTAKAFAGMLADVRFGMYDEEDKIIFLHTGGQPALFALVDHLEPILQR
jgi:D-cysteine desulfhydrase